MNEEILRVLRMVEEGKIEAEKATELIEALRIGEEDYSQTNQEDKKLKIKVKSGEGDNVNINIPVKFINSLGKAIKKIPKIEGIEGLEEIDMEEILNAVSNGLEGTIVDIKSDGGDIVEIVVE
ncbi:MAG: hypothetical protein H5T96_00285 [Tissierellales bacterium]|nr:hypothetical protein [Tissierellales bacterium]